MFKVLDDNNDAKTPLTFIAHVRLKLKKSTSR